MGKTFAAAILLLRLTLIPWLAVGAECPPVSSAVSVSEYQRQLEDLRQSLGDAKSDTDVVNISGCLPEKWSIDSHASRFEISTWAIKNDLHEIVSEKDPDDRSDAIEDLQSKLKSMSEQAALYSDHSYAAERTQLNQILAKREYRNATGPGWKEKLQDWLRALLIKVLGRAFEHVPGMLSLLQVIAWCLVLLALAFLMRYLFRRLKDATLPPVAPDHLPISATHWTDWMAHAQQAAKAGDWRGAIHFAYWAAISHLEQEGYWSPDRARTPREYLRLMSEDGERRSLLMKLTRKFEYVWYAQHQATQNDYQETLGELEALGCR